MVDNKLTPEQTYFGSILEKFNNNPDDSSLTDIERILLHKITEIQKEISGLNNQIETLNSEIKERQEKGHNVLQQLIHCQGQSQGYIDTLLALRKEQ